jgi:hypothetical protein
MPLSTIAQVGRIARDSGVELCSVRSWRYSEIKAAERPDPSEARLRSFGYNIRVWPAEDPAKSEVCLGNRSHWGASTWPLRLVSHCSLEQHLIEDMLKFDGMKETGIGNRWYFNHKLYNLIAPCQNMFRIGRMEVVLTRRGYESQFLLHALSPI